MKKKQKKIRTEGNGTKNGTGGATFIQQCGYLVERCMPWLCGAFLILFTGYMLIAPNSDLLYAIQERSLFVNTSEFFNECMEVPGGLLRWMGCYLTQYFYYPIIGALLLVLLWVGTYFTSLKAFRLQGIQSSWATLLPLCLLASIVGLGYWIYYIKHPGYWFSESLALLFVALGMWLSHAFHKFSRYVYIGIWIAAGYPLLGWWALFAACLIALRYAIRSRESRQEGWMLPLFTLVMVGVVPLLWYHYYTQVRLEDAWAYGFPQFQRHSYTSWECSYPFFAIIIVMAILAILIPERGKKSRVSLPLSVLGFALMVSGGIYLHASTYPDANFHAELRMYRHIEQGEWEEALKEVRTLSELPTGQMNMMRNIALINTGRMGEETFNYESRSQLPHRKDELKINMTQTAGPMLYYQLGLLNFATRWAIENGVENGFKVDELKILAQCALLNGEYQTAAKYIALLKGTTFHADFANELKEMLHQPELIEKNPKYSKIRELNRHLMNDLDSDGGLCEMFLTHYFANTMNIESKLLQEVTLNFAMMTKDSQLFWPRFFQYITLNKEEDTPIHYQEAAYLFCDYERNINLGNFTFDQQRIVERYASLRQTMEHYLHQGWSEKEIGRVCHKEYGDTYWWFYFFCNNKETY